MSELGPAERLRALYAARLQQLRWRWFDRLWVVLTVIAVLTVLAAVLWLGSWRK